MAEQSNIINKVRNTLDKSSMLKKNKKVLLCVSGGPDSVAMLFILNTLKRGMGLRLYICHLNHRLRGRESDKDEAYVKRLAKKFNLTIITAAEDTKAFAKRHKLSLEDAARRLRYNFFLKTAQNLKIEHIATAHTKDDQAETVLMRILRGTGLRGLTGISPNRKFCGVNLIRPIINISRSEVEAYLRKMNIKPRIDATNLKIDFFRNKIRHKLLPLIEKDYSPNIKELLSNLAELLEKDYSFLELKQKKIFKRKAKIRKDTVIFSLADFKKEHISAQRSIARTAIECLKGNLDGIDYRHWNEIEELAYERPAGSIVHLPDKIEVIKTKTVLKFLKSCKEKTTKPSPKGDVFLDIPGATAFGRRRIRATILKRCNYMKKDSKRVEYFDMDKVRLPLKMRLRRKGDKMAPLGMNSYKKLSDIFIDEKVPFKRRSAIPLVTSSDGEIIWLCGIRISDKCKILPSTKTILKLELL